MALPVALAVYGPKIALVLAIVGLAAAVGVWAWATKRENKARDAVKRRLWQR